MRRKRSREIGWLLFLRRSLSSIVVACFVIFACLLNIGSATLGNEFHRTESPVEKSEIHSERRDPRSESKTPIDASIYSKQVERYGKRGTTARSFITSLGTLALVLCVFLGLVFATKLVMPRRGRKLSRSLEIIDSCFVDSKNELTTIRWGEKLILVARGQGRWTPLSELSNEDDVKRFLETNTTEDGGNDPSRFTRLFRSLTSLDTKNTVSGE